MVSAEGVEQVKKCSLCKLKKAYSAFYYSETEDRFSSRCKDCFSVEGKERYKEKSEHIKQVVREYQQDHKQEQNDYHYQRRKQKPEGYKARSMLNAAVRQGKVIKSDHCESCNFNCKTEAHHYLGYAVENWYSVKWLCKVCHRKIEQAEPIVAENRAKPDGSYNPLFYL